MEPALVAALLARLLAQPLPCKAQRRLGEERDNRNAAVSSWSQRRAERAKATGRDG